MFIVKIMIEGYDYAMYSCGRGLQTIGLPGYATRMDAETAAKVAADFSRFNGHTTEIIPATFGGLTVQGVTAQAGYQAYRLGDEILLEKIRAREMRI